MVQPNDVKRSVEQNGEQIMTLAELLKRFDELDEAIKKTNALLRAQKMDLENTLAVLDAENIVREYENK